MTETLNIWQKLQAAMADVTHIEKGGWNDFHNYAYASDEDVLAAVHTAFVEHGLVFLPGMVEVVQGDDKTLARFEFQIVDVDTGDSITLPWHGEANDKQDKGVSKAATSAVKYFLLKLLLIPTGDKASDPDGGGDDTPTGHRTHSGVPARNDGKPGDMVIGFAPKDKPELKGKTIAQLWAIDPGWVEYLGREARQPTIKVAAAAYVQQQADRARESDLTPPPHWIDDAHVRGKFWAYAGNLGLDNEATHAALGVEHVRDFGGTMQEAKALLDAAARDLIEQPHERSAEADLVPLHAGGLPPLD